MKMELEIKRLARPTFDGKRWNTRILVDSLEATEPIWTASTFTQAEGERMALAALRMGIEDPRYQIEPKVRPGGPDRRDTRSPRPSLRPPWAACARRTTRTTNTRCETKPIENETKRYEVVAAHPSTDGPRGSVTIRPADSITISNHKHAAPNTIDF